MTRECARLFQAVFFLALLPVVPILECGLYMALAALCSQRLRREVKSRFTWAIAFGLPKCMFAVSRPMS